MFDTTNMPELDPAVIIAESANFIHFEVGPQHPLRPLNFSSYEVLLSMGMRVAYIEYSFTSGLSIICEKFTPTP